MIIDDGNDGSPGFARLKALTEREKGPVEILCKEIGFRFDSRMETTEILVSFVRVLVSHIALMRGMQERLQQFTGKTPSDNSLEVMGRTFEMLAMSDRDAMMKRAAEVHSFIHSVVSDEDYPCDHLIDMLSSCVSAIRFGLEVPCHSRHAASAAQYVWKQVYGVTLFDRFTPEWEKDWARAQLQEAILLLGLPRDSGSSLEAMMGGQ